MTDTDRLSHRLLLLGILLFAGALRFANLNWDLTQWIHPDEGHMRLITAAVHLPDRPSLYFDTAASPLNPRNHDQVYSYGTLPLFATRALAEWLERACVADPARPAPAATWVARRILPAGEGTAEAVCSPGTFTWTYSAFLGRHLSALADLGTVALLYVLGRRLYGQAVGLMAMALGAVTAFMIQQAHFYTVDSAATFFTTLTAVFAVRAAMRERVPWLDLALGGAATGLATACKVSAALAAGLVALAGLWWAVRRMSAEGDAPSEGATRAAGWLRPFIRVALPLMSAAVLALIAFRVGQPYAFEGPGFFGVRPNAEWFARLKQIGEEQRGAIDYPSGRQWTDRWPIVFPWVNMVVWGMGLPLGLAAWAGWALAGYQLVRRTPFVFPPEGGKECADGEFSPPRGEAEGGGAAKEPGLPERTPLVFPCRRRPQEGGKGCADGEFSPPRGEAEGGSATKEPRLPERTPLVFPCRRRPQEGGKGCADGEFSPPRGEAEGGGATEEPGLPERTPLVFPCRRRPQEGGKVLLLPLGGGGEIRGRHFVLWTWTTLYVAFYATRWVKAMRYFLPVYPFLILFAAFALGHALTRWRGRLWRRVAVGLTLVVTLGAAAWGIGMTGIYLRPHTRIAASRWIYANVPPGSTVANEHWDWGLPLRIEGRDGLRSTYTGIEMALYNEDTPQKLGQLLTWLDQADYLFLASNRLYGSIPRLLERYPLTTEYYRALFAGELGFELAAEFTSYLTLWPLTFPDQEIPYPLMTPRTATQRSLVPVPLPPAEESFSVYDHPNCLIFRKTSAYDPQRVAVLLGAVDLSTARVGLSPQAATPDLVLAAHDVTFVAGIALALLVAGLAALRALRAPPS